MNEPTRDRSKLSRLVHFSTSEDGHFAIDLIRNSFWFCLIGLAALGLETFITWTKASGGSEFLVDSLSFVKKAVLVGDVVWYVSRIVVGTLKAVLRGYEEIAESVARARDRKKRSGEA